MGEPVARITPVKMDQAIYQEGLAAGLPDDLARERARLDFDPTSNPAPGLLLAALEYARMGFSVIPLEPRNKRPAIVGYKPDGTPLRLAWEPYQEQTATAEEIRAWWKRWPEANIGIVCGPVSGVDVLDIDSPELAQAALDAHDPLPMTPTAKTAKGRHLYFGDPGDGIRPRKLKAPTGAPWGDLKATGGYVVAPPSTHPDGTVYAWEVPLSAGLAPLPAWLYERPAEQLAPPSCPPPRGSNGRDLTAYLEAAIRGEAEQVRGAFVGDRNEALNRAAFALGQLLHLGLDAERARAELTAAAYAVGLDKDLNCGPAGIKATIESGLQDGDKAENRRDDPREALPAEDHPRRGHMYQLGDRLPQQTAEKVAALAAQLPHPCPDPGLQKRVLDTLVGEGHPKPPTIRRRAEAGRLVLDWLRAHGEFVRSPAEDLYYLDAGHRCLYPLDALRWKAFLYTLTGVNPAGQDYAFLAADCTTAAMHAPERPVLKVAAWDAAEQVLRISRFDGTVYRLDGVNIAEEPNGAAVLFDDHSTWHPYSPDFTAPGTLRNLTDHLPNWSGDPAAYGMALRAWIVGTFFTELCPTRPLLVMLGEKGGGKTMSLRMLLLRLLFGAEVEVSGVPDKPDAFTAAAAAAHVLVMDNLDDFTPWLRDKLARLATGAVDEYRRLYTNNEVGQVKYRCWLAFTARTPDTLQRDDLADRLLLLPVERLPAERLQAERVFAQEIAQQRNAWWGDLLTTLNDMVLHIRAGHLAGPARLRMGDWETLGRCMAEVEDAQATTAEQPATATATWAGLIDTLQTAQSDFLLEGDLLAEGLALWLDAPGNAGREVGTRELYDDLTELLFKSKKPPTDWPKSVAGFGKRLKGTRRELRTRMDVVWGEGAGRRVFYRFYPKGAMPALLGS